jgi:hypothetical protein
MNGRYVHIEVRDLYGPKGGLTAEADVAIVLPDGVQTKAVAQLRTTHAPFWRVISLEDFGNPFVARAAELIGEEELFARIANAAALWNVWDAVRAKGEI